VQRDKLSIPLEVDWAYKNMLVCVNRQHPTPPTVQLQTESKSNGFPIEMADEANKRELQPMHTETALYAC